MAFHQICAHTTLKSFLLTKTERVHKRFPISSALEVEKVVHIWFKKQRLKLKGFLRVASLKYGSIHRKNDVN